MNTFKDLFNYDNYQHYGHPLTDHFPLISSVPWKLSVVILILNLIIIYGPKYMANKAAINTVPIILLYHCAMFGVNTAGLLASYWLTNGYRLIFTTGELADHTKDFKAYSVAYIAYFFFIIYMAKIIPKFCCILSKKPLSCNKKYLFSETIYIIAIYFGIKFYPGNASSLLPLSLCIVDTVDNALRICSMASPPILNYNDYSLYIDYAHIIRNLILLIHALYFASGVPMAILPIFQIIASTYQALVLCDKIVNTSSTYENYSEKKIM